MTLQAQKSGASLAFALSNTQVVEALQMVAASLSPLFLIDDEDGDEGSPSPGAEEEAARSLRILAAFERELNLRGVSLRREGVTGDGGVDSASTGDIGKHAVELLADWLGSSSGTEGGGVTTTSCRWRMSNAERRERVGGGDEGRTGAAFSDGEVGVEDL